MPGVVAAATAAGRRNDRGRRRRGPAPRGRSRAPRDARSRPGSKPATSTAACPETTGSRRTRTGGRSLRRPSRRPRARSPAAAGAPTGRSCSRSGQAPRRARRPGPRAGSSSSRPVRRSRPRGRSRAMAAASSSPERSARQPVTTSRDPAARSAVELEDRLDRLLAGRLDERARVDDDEIGLTRIPRRLVAVQHRGDRRACPSRPRSSGSRASRSKSARAPTKPTNPARSEHSKHALLAESRHMRMPETPRLERLGATASWPDGGARHRGGRPVETRCRTRLDRPRRCPRRCRGRCCEGRRLTSLISSTGARQASLPAARATHSVAGLSPEDFCEALLGRRPPFTVHLRRQLLGGKPHHLEQGSA